MRAQLPKCFKEYDKDMLTQNDDADNRTFDFAGGASLAADVGTKEIRHVIQQVDVCDSDNIVKEID